MRRCLILSSVRTIQLGITAGTVGSMELITFFTTKNRARAHTSTPYPNSYCRMCAMSPSPYKKSKPPEKFMQEITFSCLLRVCVFSGLVHIFQRSNTRSARTVYHPHPKRKPLTFILCVFCLQSVRLPPIFYFYLFFRLSSSFHAFHFPIIWYIFHALLIFFHGKLISLFRHVFSTISLRAFVAPKMPAQPRHTQCRKRCMKAIRT